MNPTIVDFIKNHKDLINENSFEELYNLEHDFDLLGTFTKILLDSGIDPLNYMTKIPARFLQGSNITEFTVPEHIKEVQYEAFTDCFDLRKITLPEGITYIGASAFSNCALEEINFPSTLNTIDFDAFAETALKNIILPDQLVQISNYCFEECKSLKSVTFGANIKSVGERSFSTCDELLIVELNEGLKLIDNYAFAECPSLQSIFIPSSVDYISRAAFYKTPVTIQCEAESYAHQYADRFGHSFQLV